MKAKPAARLPDKIRPLRVLFDTNVWRYVTDEGTRAEMLRTTRASNVQILIAPSVLYEALRTQDVKLRHRLTGLMTLSKWQRLMPEAYSESQELLGEIRRLRPDWLRAKPDRDTFTRFRYDWTRSKGGFWERVHVDPDREARIVGVLGDEQLEAARKQARERRAEFRDTAWSDTFSLNTILARPLYPVPGWEGDSIAAWRLKGWHITSLDLANVGHPYHEWLAPHVELKRAHCDDPSWTRFWFYEVSERAMPRFWLRWAFEHLQQFRKVTDGTPCDAQLATYLPEADVVVSADKGFIKIVDQCRPCAPCEFPASELIPAGRPGIDAFLLRLSDWTYSPSGSAASGWPTARNS